MTVTVPADRLYALLKEAGYRLTKPRRAVAHVLLGGQTPSASKRSTVASATVPSTGCQSIARSSFSATWASFVACNFMRDLPVMSWQIPSAAIIITSSVTFAAEWKISMPALSPQPSRPLSAARTRASPHIAWSSMACAASVRGCLPLPVVMISRRSGALCPIMRRDGIIDTGGRKEQQWSWD